MGIPLLHILASQSLKMFKKIVKKIVVWGKEFIQDMDDCQDVGHIKNKHGKDSKTSFRVIFLSLLDVGTLFVGNAKEDTMLKEVLTKRRAQRGTPSLFQTENCPVFYEGCSESNLKK